MEEMSGCLGRGDMAMTLHFSYTCWPACNNIGGEEDISEPELGTEI